MFPSSSLSLPCPHIPFKFSSVFTMSDPTFPFFPIMAGLGFFIALIPLPWHLEAWNSGTCYYMMWTAIACLNLFVNSVLWSSDAINRAPVWCDICELQTPPFPCFLFLIPIDSYTDYTRSFCRHSCIRPLHHAQAPQYFTRSLSSDDVCRGKPTHAPA